MPSAHEIPFRDPDGHRPLPARPLSILMLSPHPSVHGGVTAFVHTLTAHLTRFKVTHLAIGSIQDRHEPLLALLARVVGTPITLARLVRRGNFDVVHLNPSLTWKSVLRDGSCLLILRLLGCRRVLVYFHGWQALVARHITTSPVYRRVFSWLLVSARPYHPRTRADSTRVGVVPGHWFNESTGRGPQPFRGRFARRCFRTSFVRAARRRASSSRYSRTHSG